MSKLTLEDLRRLRKNENDRIRRANKRFQEATKAQKRVIVAKDVLTQLALGKIIASPGTYLNIDDSDVDSLFNKAEGGETWDSEQPSKTEINEAKDTQMCDVFKGMKSCSACALGSVFVSAVSIMDKLTVGDIVEDSYIGDDDGMRKYLGKVFSLKQLHMIENAFERGCVNALYKPGHKDLYCNKCGYSCVEFDNALEERCEDFCESDDPRVRLEQIMK